MNKNRVDFIRTALVPVVHGCECQAALNAALRLAADVILIGMVYVPPDAVAEHRRVRGAAGAALAARR